MRYHLNDQNVISEVLDGEALVVHLETGTYYSIQATGADIWIALLDGWSVEDIANRLVQATAVERARIEADIARFVAALEGEALIRPADGVADARRDELSFRAGYMPPELTKYTDMQELLLVDPIHEVTEEGWPLCFDKGN